MPWDKIAATTLPATTTNTTENTPLATTGFGNITITIAKIASVAIEMNDRITTGNFIVRPRSYSSAGKRSRLASVSLFGLLEAMQRVLAKIPAGEARHTVSRVRITLQQAMIEVMDRLRAAVGATVLFEDLLAAGAELTRERVVLTFLSILDFAKIQALLIFQNLLEDRAAAGPIRVRLAVESAPDEAAIERAAVEAEAEFTTGVEPDDENDEGTEGEGDDVG